MTHPTPPRPAAPASSPSEQQEMVTVPREALEQALHSRIDKPCPGCGAGYTWVPSETTRDTVGNPVWEGRVHHLPSCRVAELRAALAQPQPAAAADAGLRAGVEALTRVLKVLDEVARLDEAEKKLSAESTELARRARAGEKVHRPAPQVVDYGDVWSAIKRLRPAVKKALRSLATTPAPQAQAEAGAEVDEVGNLLAVMHGDGGHYETEHGRQKAARDAIDHVYGLVRVRDAAVYALASQRVPDAALDRLLNAAVGKWARQHMSVETGLISNLVWDLQACRAALPAQAQAQGGER